MRNSYRDMDPLDALDETITASVISSRDLRKPGAVVAIMSKRVRAALERLTSDILLNARPKWLP